MFQDNFVVSRHLWARAAADCKCHPSNLILPLRHSVVFEQTVFEYFQCYIQISWGRVWGDPLPLGHGGGPQVPFQCIDPLQELGSAMGGHMPTGMPGLDMGRHSLHPVVQSIRMHLPHQGQGPLSLCPLFPQLRSSFCTLLPQHQQLALGRLVVRLHPCDHLHALPQVEHINLWIARQGRACQDVSSHAWLLPLMAIPQIRGVKPSMSRRSGDECLRESEAGGEG